MKTLLQIAILVFFLLPSQPTLGEMPPPWIKYARDLFTGDEKKIVQSKEWFSSHPSAHAELIKGLSDPQQNHLALDTLVTLERREIIPHLLENLVTNTDGSYALALSALMNKDNAQLILGRFRRLIESDRGGTLPFTLVLPVLDTLARLHILISPAVLSRLHAQYGPEVRLALVGYLRQNVTRPSNDLDWLYETLLTDRAYQVRLAALSLPREFPHKFANAPARKACAMEKQSLLLQFCQRFLKPEFSE